MVSMTQSMKTLTAHRPHHRQSSVTRALATDTDRPHHRQSSVTRALATDTEHTSAPDDYGTGGDDYTGEDDTSSNGGHSNNNESPACDFLPPICAHGARNSDMISNNSDDPSTHHHPHQHPGYVTNDDWQGSNVKRRINSVDSTNQSEMSNTKDSNSHVRYHHSSGDTTDSHHHHTTSRHPNVDSDNTARPADGQTSHRVLWHSKPARLSLTMPPLDNDTRRFAKTELSPGQGHTVPQVNEDGGNNSSFAKSRSNKSWCAAEHRGRTGRSQTMENAYRTTDKRNTSLVRDASLRRGGGATGAGHTQQPVDQLPKHKVSSNNPLAAKAAFVASNSTLRRVLSFNNISSPSPQLHHIEANGAGSKKPLHYQQRPTATVRPILHVRATARDSSVPRNTRCVAANNDTLGDGQSTYNSEGDKYADEQQDDDGVSAERRERILDWLIGVANEGGAEKPVTPPLIADMPPQTDTAIHIVYVGD